MLFYEKRICSEDWSSEKKKASPKTGNQTKLFEVKGRLKWTGIRDENEIGDEENAIFQPSGLHPVAKFCHAHLMMDWALYKPACDSDLTNPLRLG